MPPWLASPRKPVKLPVWSPPPTVKRGQRDGGAGLTVIVTESGVTPAGPLTVTVVVTRQRRGTAVTDRCDRRRRSLRDDARPRPGQRGTRDWR